MAGQRLAIRQRCTDLGDDLQQRKKSGTDSFPFLSELAPRPSQYWPRYFLPSHLARPSLLALEEWCGTVGSASMTTPVGWAHHAKHRHNFPLLGATASIVGPELPSYRAPALRFANRSWRCLRSMDSALPGLGMCQLQRVFLWGRFSKNPLPRPNRLRMLPASGAVLAHNTRGDMSILSPADLVLSGQGFRVPAFSMLSAGAARCQPVSMSQHQRSAIQYPK